MDVNGNLLNLCAFIYQLKIWVCWQVSQIHHAKVPKQDVCFRDKNPWFTPCQYLVVCLAYKGLNRTLKQCLSPDVYRREKSAPLSCWFWRRSTMRPSIPHILIACCSIRKTWAKFHHVLPFVSLSNSPNSLIYCSHIYIYVISIQFKCGIAVCLLVEKSTPQDSG